VGEYFDSFAQLFLSFTYSLCFLFAVGNALGFNFVLEGVPPFTW
jgi:hypothetical protein